MAQGDTLMRITPAITQGGTTLTITIGT